MTPTLSHPWLLVPATLAALVILGLALRAHLRPGLGVQVVGQRPLWQGLGLALVALGLGLGLAEPRWGTQDRPRLTVHVVLDASRSMTVPDTPGGRTRWEAAAAALDRLWSQPEPGLRWSLDLLTGDAIPVQPPGEDRVLLRESLKALAPGAVGSPGTSLGRGLLQVAAQAEAGAPAVILLLSDGEETWERPDEAVDRALAGLRQIRLPLYALAYGDGRPHPVAGEAAAGSTEPALSTARPDLLERLARESGGRLFTDPERAAADLQALAAGQLPLPAGRSLQPAHPEAGAWLALLGLLLWLFHAGQPMARWRPVLLLALALATPGLEAQSTGSLGWVPNGVRGWLAQRALGAGDLHGAQRWRPGDAQPDHLLLAAQIDLRAGQPEGALKTLAPLVGQGVPRPLPAWRTPALLLAARAQVEAGRPEEARAILERLLLEQPGRPEAIHNLQTLIQDALPPPPPPKRPPPPPPPRPSLGAQQDEAEGLRQRLPKPPKTAGGVRDW